MRLRLTAVACLALAAACSSESQTNRMPPLRLPMLEGKTAPSLAACPAPKCLTVYVAPWCGACHMASPVILQLRRYLASRGVATRIIVGMDEPAAVRSFARAFGPDTLLDPAGDLRVDGTPYFFVTDPHGRILNEAAGMPMGLESLSELAAAYGLP